MARPAGPCRRQIATPEETSLFTDRQIVDAPAVTGQDVRDIVIQVQGLSKSYGTQSILSAVDLTVQRGEIAAVIGRSGAGKSSLLRCINLLERPTAGSVRVAGVDLTALSPAELARARSRIGFIFQSSNLLRRATVADNVGLPLRYAGVGRAERAARVSDLLARVGLSGRGKDYPHALSGGQRQRVGIARALALNPMVLLADEPTSGLDPQTTSEFLALLGQLRTELDLTVLLITHEMAVVRAIADRAALIEQGRIVDSGRVHDLVTDPASVLGAALLGTHAALPQPVGQRLWAITYARQNVPADWPDRLSRRVNASVSLLGGVIENIGGWGAGRLTIALPSTVSADVSTELAVLGLHGLPLETGA